MKVVIVTTAMLVFCSVAQSASECSAIKNGKTRLACFDKAYPANMKAMPAATEKANPFAKEDALTTAKLNGICRGC